MNTRAHPYPATRRGDALAVEQGRLTPTPASGRPVPADWLAKHSTDLITQAASIAEATALEYAGHSVGHYGLKLAGGVILKFRCLTTGKKLFAIFNANTKRARTTRHGNEGDPLPLANSGWARGARSIVSGRAPACHFTA
ncbi:MULTISPECIES: hypothetical protein [Gammaproteobacteria]|uniref:Uncharacterized protein n=1 Tax=Alloalcanivorax xenomutans TaxID=1094342 RepID=A0A9Q3W8F1_9GAMM|nr:MULTISPECIES: hypothetical protein [Gammaproteobacteria]ARB47205.1 hypothetical protein P40_18840 [Alloalcanivorax xenomutans]MCE7510925.1 hypothetical protein [Alloalcanivorax xenomutans]HIO99720.1 hypothetical protein [Marinobacter salarius]